MNFQQVFNSYWNKYRGDDSAPGVTDPEWNIALMFANDAIMEWRNTDGVYWNELYDTLQNASDGDKTVTTGKLQYQAPSDMDVPGGYLRLYSPTSTAFSLVPVIEPGAAQIQATTSNFAYFTGDPQDGYTLNFNPGVIDPAANYLMDYVYYKFPRPVNGPSDLPNMRDPMYMVYYMLRERFLNSRNTTGYSTADRQCTGRLANMEIRNAQGSPYNQWSLTDPQGGGFGAPFPSYSADILRS